MKTRLLLFPALLTAMCGGLSCGIYRAERSAEQLSSSKQAYEDCLRTADDCSRQQALYQADLAEYNARHRALANYGAARIIVNNQP